MGSQISSVLTYVIVQWSLSTQSKDERNRTSGFRIRAILVFSPHEGAWINEIINQRKNGPSRPPTCLKIDIWVVCTNSVPSRPWPGTSGLEKKVGLERLLCINLVSQHANTFEKQICAMIHINKKNFYLVECKHTEIDIFLVKRLTKIKNLINSQNHIAE